MTTQLDSHSSLGLGPWDVMKCVYPSTTAGLEKIRGRRVIFSVDDREMVPIGGWGLKSNPYCHSVTVNTFGPQMLKSTVVGVDSSCVKVGETEEGTLYAVKCGVALASSGHGLMHSKLGPILFYIGESTISGLAVDHKLAKILLLDSELAKRLLRIRIERAILAELSDHLGDSIILVDGSLKASVFEEPNTSLSKVAENCVLHKNLLVGICKTTRLKLLQMMAAPLERTPSPAYIEVTLIVKGLGRNSLADHNLIAKLAKNSPVLRVDIIGNKDRALGLLIRNDQVTRGYPETLRLAHHISAFCNTDMTCLRSHVLNSYDVTEIASEDIRKTLLGSVPI